MSRHTDRGRGPRRLQRFLPAAAGGAVIAAGQVVILLRTGASAWFATTAGILLWLAFIALSPVAARFVAPRTRQARAEQESR